MNGSLYLLEDVGVTKRMGVSWVDCRISKVDMQMASQYPFFNEFVGFIELV